jgi:hypothetical protein
VEEVPVALEFTPLLAAVVAVVHVVASRISGNSYVMVVNVTPSVSGWKER